jgi:transcriptional regulator of acetoin/glycerol metabolism
VLAQFIELPAPPEVAEGEAVSEEGEYARAVARFETDYLKGLLKKHRWNIDAAAREAGMNMATIYRKMKKYGIKRDETP